MESWDAHKICDPVHGFIRYNALEKQLIDTPAFQRLRYLRQMGMAYLVYPGATHTRFEHSLGVMHLADKIFMTLFPSDAVPFDRLYWRQVVRLAALCHDLGHLPFSHTAEKVLLPDGGHERMTRALIESEALQEIWRRVGPHALQDILKLAMTEHGLPLNSWEPLLAKIITDDNFGADRIDYLVRDAYWTGAGYGSFDARQLIDTLRVVEGEVPEIGVHVSGVQAVEALWVARYMMHARVAHHPKVRLYSYHMARVMQMHYASVGFPKNVEEYLDQFDDTVLAVTRGYARAGNYDAQVVLLRQKPFQSIHWGGPIDEKGLLKTFNAHVLIDHVEQKKAHRHFPVVLDDKNTLNAEQVAPFLSSIPLGVPGPYLYAHPQWRQQVIHYLEAAGEYADLAPLR